MLEVGLVYLEQGSPVELENLPRISGVLDNLVKNASSLQRKPPCNDPSLCLI